MINLIKNNTLPLAIILLAITQLPDFIAKHNQNRCVADAIDQYTFQRMYRDNDFLNAVWWCNGGD